MTFARRLLKKNHHKTTIIKTIWNGYVPHYVKLNAKEFVLAGYHSVFLIPETNKLLRKKIKKSLSELNPNTYTIIFRRSIGKDFGAFRAGVSFLRKKKSKIDRLFLQNDSMIGPLGSSNLLEKLESLSGDVLGITESYQHHYHLQSSVLLLKNKATLAGMNFFKKFPYYRNRQMIIDHGEIGFSQHMSNHGFSLNAILSYNELISSQIKSDILSKIS